MPFLFFVFISLVKILNHGAYLLLISDIHDTEIPSVMSGLYMSLLITSHAKGERGGGGVPAGASAAPGSV